VPNAFILIWKKRLHVDSIPRYMIIGNYDRVLSPSTLKCTLVEELVWKWDSNDVDGLQLRSETALLIKINEAGESVPQKGTEKNFNFEKFPKRIATNITSNLEEG
jgi:hypothetical protein